MTLLLDIMGWPVLVSTASTRATSAGPYAPCGRVRRHRRAIIDEAKGRHYKGSVTPYQRNQVTLYLDMVDRFYRRPVKAVLLYGNGRRVRWSATRSSTASFSHRPRPAVSQWPTAAPQPTSSSSTHGSRSIWNL